MHTNLGLKASTKQYSANASAALHLRHHLSQLYPFKIKSYTNRATGSCERCSQGRVSQTAEEKGKFQEGEERGSK